MHLTLNATTRAMCLVIFNWHCRGARLECGVVG